jgi:hypothetical protein
MTARNAASIGLSLGKVLDVENCSTKGIIVTHHLRIRVAIDTCKPLVLGFSLPRPGRSASWVRFLYEHLVDYCTICGLIGHRKNFCPAPLPQGPQDKYGISLCAFVLSGPRSSSSPSLKVQALPSAPATTVFASPMMKFSSTLICAPSFAAVFSALPQQTTTVSIHHPTQLTEHVLQDLASPQAVLLPHVTPYNPYLHILGHEAATSLAASTLSSVKPASPTERGKGVLIASDISSVALGNSPLAMLMFGLSPPILSPSLGPPVHPFLTSSPSSLSQPNIILPPSSFQLASEMSPSSHSHHIWPSSFKPPFFEPSKSSPKKITLSGSRYRPYPPKTPTGPLRGLVPGHSPPSPGRSSHPIGRKRPTAFKDLDLSSPRLKRRSSPPYHSPRNLHDRIDMVAYSLSSLKHVVVSPVALTTAFSFQPL